MQNFHDTMDREIENTERQAAVNRRLNDESHDMDDCPTTPAHPKTVADWIDYFKTLSQKERLSIYSGFANLIENPEINYVWRSDIDSFMYALGCADKAISDLEFIRRHKDD